MNNKIAQSLLLSVVFLSSHCMYGSYQSYLIMQQQEALKLEKERHQAEKRNAAKKQHPLQQAYQSTAQPASSSLPSVELDQFSDAVSQDDPWQFRDSIELEKTKNATLSKRFLNALKSIVDGAKK